MTDDARLFVGLELSEAARAAMDAYRRKLASVVSGKLTPSSLYHLTLCFLGRTPREGIRELSGVFDRMDKQPFALALGKLGTFKKGSILWVGIEEPCLALYALQRSLSDALNASGFMVEPGAYVPHITLGRQIRRPDKLPDPPHAEFSVTHVTLFESTRMDGELAYVPLYRSVCQNPS